MEIALQLLSWLKVALVFVTMMSVLIAAHEYGHYLFARLFKMGIEEFAIGLGKPQLWVWLQKKYQLPLTPAEAEYLETPGETVLEEATQFTIRPWPLGGFVRIKGMMPAEDGSEVHTPGGFYSKPPLHRFVVLLAGPAFSVLAGILIMFGVFMAQGEPRMHVVVDKTRAKMPAEGVLLPGDRILKMNGAEPESPKDFALKVIALHGQVANLEVGRGDQTLQFSITPKPVPGVANSPALLGITPRLDKLYFAPTTPAKALGMAMLQPVLVIDNIAAIFRRQVDIQDSVGGPVAIVQQTSQAVNSGLLDVVSLAAMLSISVGIFNLLPIFPLDGGQMAVAVVEMFRGGRRLSIRFQEAIGAAGLMIMVCMVVGVLFIDLKRGMQPKTPPAKAAPAAQSPR